MGVILCIVIAFASVFAIRTAANNAHNILNAARVNISIHVAAPAQMVQILAERVSKVDPNSIDETSRVAVKDVQLLFRKSETALSIVVNRTKQLFRKLEAMNNKVCYLSKNFFVNICSTGNVYDGIDPLICMRFHTARFEKCTHRGVCHIARAIRSNLDVHNSVDLGRCGIRYVFGSPFCIFALRFILLWVSISF